MIKPVNVRVDLDAKAGYVRYAEGTVKTTLDVWEDGWVAADIDDADNILGIEVLGLDDETLTRAREFAESKGLAFPSNLSGVLTPA